MGEVVGKGHHWLEGQNHSPPEELQSTQATCCWAFRLCRAGVLGPALGPCTRHGSNDWRTSRTAEPSPWPKGLVKRRWKSKRKSDAPGRRAAENRKQGGTSRGTSSRRGKARK